MAAQGNGVRRSFWIGLMGMVLWAWLGMPAVQAAMLNVPSQYWTLQAALDAARDGDTIVIAPSPTPYQFSAVKLRSYLTGDFRLVIRGEGDPALTTIESTLEFIRPPSSVGTVMITVYGLTIRSPQTLPPLFGLLYAGLSGPSDQVRLINCIVEGHNTGVQVNAVDMLQVTHSVIRNNGRGVQLGNGGNGNSVSLLRSTVIDNREAGIYISPPGRQAVAVTDSVVALNGVGYPHQRAGIYVFEGPSGGGSQSFPITVTTRNALFYRNQTRHISAAVVFQNRGKTVFLDPADGQPTVICTELHRQGLIPTTWFLADSAYAQLYIDPETRAAYVLWAQPLARLMQRSRLVTAVVRPFAVAWAQHMAYMMGASAQDSELGRWLTVWGTPLHRAFGKRFATS